MTAEQQIARITEVIKKYDLDDVTKDEFDSKFELQRVIDIKDEMWELYCFMGEVVDIINM